jgi:molybdopterin converting factor small subunit
MASVKIILFATLRSKYKTRELTVTCEETFQNLLENVSKILGPEFLPMSTVITVRNLEKTL